MAQIPEELLSLTGKDLAKRKVDLLARSGITRTFSHRGITVEFIGPIQIAEDKLIVSVAAKRGENQIPIDNPLIYVNPPVITGDSEFNPKEALKEIIVQTVESQEV
jgi:hypothetical protein